MSSGSLELLVEKMPPLPNVAVQVLSIIRDPEYPMAELVSVVRTDPALTARILKLCNSSLFSLKHEIATIAEALSFLGTRNILQIVVSTCTSTYFRSVKETPLLDPVAIWKHSVATALCAQHLADRCGGGGIEPGVAFTTGILHNLGKVGIAQSCSDVEAPQRTDGQDALVFEREAFGFDHAEAADAVTRRWALPHDIRRAIRNHHHEARLLSDSLLTPILHVADVLALQCGIGEMMPGLSIELSPGALERLGLDDSAIESVREQMLSDLAASAELIETN